MDCSVSFHSDFWCWMFYLYLHFKYMWNVHTLYSWTVATIINSADYTTQLKRLVCYTFSQPHKHWRIWNPTCVDRRLVLQVLLKTSTYLKMFDYKLRSVQINIYLSAFQSHAVLKPSGRFLLFSGSGPLSFRALLLLLITTFILYPQAWCVCVFVCSSYHGAPSCLL